MPHHSSTRSAKGRKYIKSGESLSSGLWLVPKAESERFFAIDHCTGSLRESAGTIPKRSKWVAEAQTCAVVLRWHM